MMLSAVILVMNMMLKSEPFDEIKNREVLSTVIVRGLCQEHCNGIKETVGAGEIIGRQSGGTIIVATARHVVAHMDPPDVYTSNGTEHTGEILAVSLSDDLAIIKFHIAKNDRYAMSIFSKDSMPERGNVVGNPHGKYWTSSLFHYISKKPDSLVINCRTCGAGDSGGGVFDEEGKLSGILVSQLVPLYENENQADKSSRFRAIPIERLKLFIRALVGK